MMTENKTLSARQRRFIVALLDARTVREAAAKASIAEATAWRYLSDDVVKTDIARRQDAMLVQVTQGIVSDMTEARGVLVDIMRDAGAPEGVRVRAAGLILDAGLKMLEVLTLSDRVTVLEKQIGG